MGKIVCKYGFFQQLNWRKMNVLKFANLWELSQIQFTVKFVLPQTTLNHCSKTLENIIKIESIKVNDSKICEHLLLLISIKISTVNSITKR